MAKFAAKGPMLGTKLFILTSFILVVIPWFSYLYLSEMEEILVDSQASAQLLTAEGISTLLNGRDDLFDELPISPDGYEKLYAHPLEKPIRIDGKDTDWEDVLDFNVGFGQTSLADPTTGAPNQFYLVLGEHKGQVYALVQILDDSLIYRDKEILRLDLSDHIRVTYSDTNNQIQKLVITATEEGLTTAYPVGDNWRYAINGEADNRIPGVLFETVNGYAIEFRIPLDLLGASRNFGLAVVDVDSARTRAIESITGTLPSASREAFGLVLLKTPEVLRIIEGLGYSGANIQVVDSRKRIRAEVGSYRAQPSESLNPASGDAISLARLTDWMLDPLYTLVERTLSKPEVTDEEATIQRALNGSSSTSHFLAKNEGEVIVAAHPIIANDQILGAVVLKQNTNRILNLRRDALKRIVNFSVISVILFAAIILIFSARLARRIRRLGLEANSVIDGRGRLTASELTAETRSGDELGDLARSISNMLTRLHQHNQFLENMPRTLRHEINNPLNTLSTSLENLREASSEDDRNKYLESARRGLNRIGLIVQNLADAANLEEALVGEDLECLDLRLLLQSYITNCQITHPTRSFTLQMAEAPLLAWVCDYRIEQLLDKLIDNAIDFSEPGSDIQLELEGVNKQLNLTITNVGEPVPSNLLDSIFDSMVTARAGNPDNRLHFGMGLYVVRVITEHHGGTVSIQNLPELPGVQVNISLPLAEPFN
jgi:two-component system sensor histidine kinase ChvG